MKLRLILVLIALVGFAGCGPNPFEQDPLKDQPDNIRNGVPPQDRPEKPDARPLCKTCVVVEMNNGEPIHFHETQEGRFNVKVTVFRSQLPRPIKAFDVVLSNPDKFPGATFALEKEIPLDDPNEQKIAQKEYVFTWTPPQGTTGDETLVNKFLSFNLITNEDRILTEEHRQVALVDRSFTVPVIDDMTFEKDGAPITSINEGDTGKLTIKVTDTDSSDEEAPTVKFVKPSANAHDGSPFAYFNNATRDATTKQWTLVYDLDLVDHEVTRSSQDVTFVVNATSRFGKISPTLTKTLTIKNVLKDPVLSIAPDATYTLASGKSIAISFTASDTAQEGEVTATVETDLTTLPGTATMACASPAGKPYVHSCEITWDLPAGVKANPTYTIAIQVINQSHAGGFSGEAKKLDQTLTVNITGATPPDPTPVPTPTPVPATDTGSGQPVSGGQK
jgi:hypothetical protein